MDSRTVCALVAEADAAFRCGPASVGLAMVELCRALVEWPEKPPGAAEVVQRLTEAERASTRRDLGAARDAYDQVRPRLQEWCGGRTGW